MSKRVSRPGVREGYDRWSADYDQTPNPLVALDRRHTFDLLEPRPGERILDAGCGTGAHLRDIGRWGAQPVGIDFSRGMLRVARRANPGVPLAQADLNEGLPLKRDAFDAFLCALVSEHLTRLDLLFAEAFAVLHRHGRLVFSAFHPELATAGIEANFEQAGVEYRLGAEPYTVDDYLHHIDAAGFHILTCHEHRGDDQLAEQIPQAGRYVNQPLLLTIEAVKGVALAACSKPF